MKCHKCKGSGLDTVHLWPDGTPSHCESCSGYGDRPPTPVGEWLRSARDLIGILALLGALLFLASL